MTHPFITHNGGPCPVSPDTVVDVRLRCGEVMPPAEAVLWMGDHTAPDFWLWHGGRSNNIIAYRIHQPEEGEAS